MLGKSDSEFKLVLMTEKIIIQELDKRGISWAPTASTIENQEEHIPPTESKGFMDKINSNF